MKRVLQMSLMVLLVTFVSASCSKEKKIERRLTRKTGKWNIEHYETQFYENGVLVESSSYHDIGYFTFDDDGTVIQTYTQGGTTYTYAGTWSNTENTITFIEDGDAAVWSIKEDSKKEMTIQLIDQYSNGGTDYRDEYTIELERD